MTNSLLNRILLAMLLVSISVGCSRQKKGKLAAADFESLRQDVMAGKFDQTIPRLESFISDYPNSKQASRAGLFLFKCHFAKNELDKAKKWCDWTIKTHPSSLEASKCKFKLAMIKLVDGKIDQAKSEFKSLSEDATIPQSAESKRLAMFLENYSIEKKK